MQGSSSRSVMQDPTTFHPLRPHFPEQEQLKCPRCESSNTKFCYYNNYNLSQPRHFCKNCRRYWTKGGALRNIPVGGGSRKNAKRPSSTKRPSPSSSSSASTTALQAQNSGHNPNSDRVCNSTMDQERRMLNIPGSFSSLLASNGQYGGFLESLNSNGSDLKMAHMGALGNFNSDLNSGSDRNLRLEVQSSNNSENYLSLQSGDSSGWSNGNGWPDLAIFTPGSNFP